MKHHHRLLLVALSLAFGVSLSWAQKISSVQSVGDGSFSVTATATNKFTRNTDKLKAAGIDAATQFCAKDGKQFKLVSTTEDKSMYLVGAMASTTIVFRAVAPGSPEPAAAPTGVTPAVTPATDAFAADMMKLDDLHKRGILTDEEYASAKKKVLDRLK